MRIYRVGDNEYQAAENVEDIIALHNHGFRIVWAQPFKEVHCDDCKTVVCHEHLIPWRKIKAALARKEKK